MIGLDTIPMVWLGDIRLQDEYPFDPTILRAAATKIETMTPLKQQQQHLLPQPLQSQKTTSRSSRPPVLQRSISAPVTDISSNKLKTVRFNIQKMAGEGRYSCDDEQQQQRYHPQHHFDEDDMSRIWWTSSELAEITRTQKKIASDIRNRNKVLQQQQPQDQQDQGQILIDPTTVVIPPTYDHNGSVVHTRGLEDYLSLRAALDARARRVAVRQAVLDEQRRQKFSAATTAPILSSMTMTDPVKIRKKCREASKKSRMIARELALYDEKEAQKIHQETEEEEQQDQKLSRRRRRAPYATEKKVLLGLSPTRGLSRSKSLSLSPPNSPSRGLSSKRSNHRILLGLDNNDLSCSRKSIMQQMQDDASGGRNPAMASPITTRQQRRPGPRANMTALLQTNLRLTRQKGFQRLQQQQQEEQEHHLLLQRRDRVVDHESRMLFLDQLNTPPSTTANTSASHYH